MLRRALRSENDGVVIRDEEHAARQPPTEVVGGLRRVDDQTALCQYPALKPTFLRQPSIRPFCPEADLYVGARDSLKRPFEGPLLLASKVSRGASRIPLPIRSIVQAAKTAGAVSALAYEARDRESEFFLLHCGICKTLRSVSKLWG